MELIRIINDPLDSEIIKLIEQGLSDEEIARQIPFTTVYVANLRFALKECSQVQQKGV